MQPFTPPAPGQVVAVDANEYARLLAENAALKANQKSAPRGDISIGNDLSIKVAVGGKIDKKTGRVSKGGGVSVYGIHSRFPVTMYGEQWLRLLASADAIKAFVEAHKSELSTKPKELK